MTEQTQHMQSWAERTVELPKEPNFLRGVASVTPPTHPQADQATAYEPAYESAPYAPVPPRPRLRLRDQLRQLRPGGKWSVMGTLFAFVCWGIWAISSQGNLASPILAFVLSLCVAAGLFGLCRMLGRVVLERQLGRVRRSATASHITTAVFLVGVGVAYLRQTEWVMSVWSWLTGLW